MPTRNRPRRLSGALASVLSQTHRDIELVVVDDGSETPAEGVVDMVARGDPRVRVARHLTSKGAATARNTGIALSTGELISFLDDDDRWKPTKLARQIEYLRAHPEVGIVTCDHEVMIEGGNRRPVAFRGAHHFDHEHLLWVNFAGSFSFVMARRDLLGDELVVDESFSSVEDWDLWLRCARRAPIGVVREPLTVYVKHRESRLSDVESNRRGLEAFGRKHAHGMSGACLAFHRAHRKMERGSGWGKRRHTAEGLVSGFTRAPVPLVAEQCARQLGRLRGDPGLSHRVLAALISREQASTYDPRLRVPAPGVSDDI